MQCLPLRSPTLGLGAALAVRGGSSCTRARRAILALSCLRLNRRLLGLSPPIPLLPSITLLPPSPPQMVMASSLVFGESVSILGWSKSLPTLGSALNVSATSNPNNLDALSPMTTTSSVFFTPKSSPHQPLTPRNKLSFTHSPGKWPGQQSASLGRVSAAGVAGGSGGADTCGGLGGGAGNGNELPPRNS
ncbi:hypothetical protein BDZ97DRAFT_739940 [Flammula alnicola]|nr:hypothetical protein BDZ97DRAFT_739940 [Flammula alnicola]